MVMNVILPVRDTMGFGSPVSEISPLQPNQMPPLSRSAASNPTASPPAVVALESDTGVTRFETTTKRFTVSVAAGSGDVLLCSAELHGTVGHADQRSGLGKVPNGRSSPD